MKNNREKVAWSLVVLATLCISMPVIFGEPRKVDDQHGGDAWRNAIYDFQTLITGIAAVVAAYLAVNQSRIIEANSERRHQQLMELSLRPARLMINRTVFPMVDYIEDALEEMTAWHASVRGQNGAWFIAENVRDLSQVATAWARTVSNKQLDIAEAYFDGDMVHALLRSRSAAQSIDQRASVLVMRMPPLTGRVGEKEEIIAALKDDVEGLHSELSTLLEFLTQFSFGLRKLQKDYLTSV